MDAVPEATPAQLADLATWPDTADRPWVRANMVVTLDGSITGPSGTSRTISSAEDHELLLLLRRTCDVIMIGASTARAEGYRRPAVPLVIISGSLRGLADVPALREDDTTGRPRPIVITTERSDPAARQALEPYAEVEVCGEEAVDLGLALAALDRRGYRRVHCEGGPHLLGELVSADLLDELFVTITPILLGGTHEHHLIDVEGFMPREVQFTSIHSSNGSVFLRAAVRGQ